MRIKTIIIVVITVLLTVVLMQNTGQVNFKFLWVDTYFSKLVALAAFAALGFILGLLVARPKKVKRLADEPPYNAPNNDKTSTLSDDDKNYIN